MMPDRYNPEHDITPAFMAQVAAWLVPSGEVFVIVRYLRSAGSKDYAFCRSIREFDELARAAPTGADIEVFRQPQLPLRGLVTDGFIANALASIRDGSEFMVVSQRRHPGSVLSVCGSFGDNHEDLRNDLEALRGHDVAFGPCPDFNAADNADLISASKGGIDGPR